MTEDYVVDDPSYLQDFSAVLEDVIAGLTNVDGTAIHPKLIPKPADFILLRT